MAREIKGEAGFGRDPQSLRLTVHLRLQIGQAAQGVGDVLQTLRGGIDGQRRLRACACGRLLGTAHHFLDAASEIPLRLADRPLLIEHLMERGIDGPSFVKELRDRQDVPLLMLPRP